MDNNLNETAHETSTLTELNSATSDLQHSVTIEVNEEEKRAYVTIHEASTYPGVQQIIDRLVEENIPYWIDEETIRKELANKTTGSPFAAAFARDGSFVITTDSQDRYASLTLKKAYGGKETDMAEIEEKLQEMGIISGIDHENISLALSEKNYDTPVVIAKTIEPIHGINARIECTFPLEFKMQPRELEHQKVDFRDLQLIHTSGKGELLARKIPPTPGNPGINIKGKVLPAKPGKDIKLTAGRNCTLSDDGMEATAAIDGQPFLKGKAVFVEPVYRIQGNVDYSIGNVDFKGSVIIDGSVVTGFSVKATESIEIKGVVEDCVIEAGMDISIKGGILGADTCILKAGRDFSSLFAENCHVDAGRNIVTGDTLNAVLSAGDSIDVVLGKGRVIGSRLSARNLIAMNIMGSRIANRTQISVGHEPKAVNRLKKTKKDVERTEYVLEEIEKHIRTIEGLKRDCRLSEEKETLYCRLLATKEEQGHLLEALKGDVEMLEHTITRSQQPVVKVRNICYPNVRIRIGWLIFDSTTEYRSAVFYEEEEKIKVSVYEDGV